MNKRKIALLLNIAIIVLELIGFGYTIYKDHSIAVEYYTNDSNIIALISSIIFVIFYKKKKEFVKDLRLLSTILLTLTFIVVILILTPMYNFNYTLLMFTDTFIIFHTLVPIISFISYVFFEEGSKMKYVGLIFTGMYAIVLLILNAFDLIVGPYPFLEIKKQSPIMCITWGLIIIIGSYIIGFTIYKLNKKINKRS